MKIFRNKLAVTIVLLSVTFLILIFKTIKSDNISLTGNGIGVTFNAIQGGIYKFNSKVKDSVSFIFNFSNVKKENEELRKKNSELESKALDYDSLKEENEKLRGMLNFKDQRSEYDYIGSDIIGKSGSGLLDQFVINKGSKDGIQKQMIAITEQGLVGQVTSTGSNWAIVQSLSNENLAVSGTIESTNDNGGIVKGYKDSDNRLLAKLYYLPLDSNIKTGDVILTSGLGGIYPKGIRIGSVISVEEDKGKVMKNAIIKPYVDFNKLEEVFIVLPKNKIDVKY
ncbi:rod shape-determining protein MreC [Clostridium magnum]|uniref:Cell shape-determining protein MreC n=1 Tax=Clostridium magnum DSM 2767 TaxID=1121326 RepID=A0A162UFD0_9CLOT|nr:rod shape-determining protein MreC [Clostridium magnum]KZL93841.1 cell shape-determining protein MreC precursor [Clostridium magnum DSM 2767]SHI07959.1 rod shape-determining protein MreC [Clostridium magnum DSM 2767]